MKDLTWDLVFGWICIWTAIVFCVIFILSDKPETSGDWVSLMFMFSLGSARIELNSLKDKLKTMEDKNG